MTSGISTTAQHQWVCVRGERVCVRECMSMLLCTCHGVYESRTLILSGQIIPEINTTMQHNRLTSGGVREC